jgi:alkylation response protein AidB-like acyl-CoA dehydrogenase
MSKRDRDGVLLHDFHTSMAEAGWFGITEAGFEACHTALSTLGGMGYAQEYHVERYLREILLITPTLQQREFQ